MDLRECGNSFGGLFGLFFILTFIEVLKIIIKEVITKLITKFSLFLSAEGYKNLVSFFYAKKILQKHSVFKGFYKLRRGRDSNPR